MSDNFFELGGHSLSVAQLIARISDQFGVDLHYSRVFESKSLTDLASTVATLIETANEAPQLPTALTAHLRDESVSPLPPLHPGSVIAPIANRTPAASSASAGASSRALAAAQERSAVLSSAAQERLSVLQLAHPQSHASLSLEHLPVVEIGRRYRLS